MSSLNKKSSTKVTAIILALTLLASTIPMSLFNVFAQTLDFPNSYTITVMDSDRNAPIENASVTVDLNGVGQFTGTTNSNGVTAPKDLINEINLTDEIFALSGPTEMKVSVTSTGYETITDRIIGNVISTNSEDNYTVYTTLSEYKIDSTTPVADMQVEWGTVENSIGLPNTVAATLNNTKTATLPITWECATTYDKNTVGTYTFNGSYNTTDASWPTKVVTTGAPYISVKVNVVNYIKSINTDLTAKNVDYGTSLSSIDLVDTINVKISDGTNVNLPVTWASSPEYSSTTSQKYKFTGTYNQASGSWVAGVDTTGADSFSIEVTVNAETTAPEITDEKQNPLGWTKEAKTISAKITDADSGIDEGKVFYATTSGAITGTTLKKGTGDVWTSPEISANGNYYIVAYDNAGNKSEASVVVDKIETTVPAIVGEAQSSLDWVKTNKTISATITDADSGINPSKVFYATVSSAITGTALTKGTGDVWTSPAITTNGTYYIIAYDNAGNRSYASVKVDKIDLNAPVISNEIQNTANWVNTSKTISATILDENTTNSTENSGIDRAFYSTNSASTTGIALSNTSGNVWASPAITANGTYYIIAYDKVGFRTVSSAITVDRIDLNVPVISGESQSTANWVNTSKTISATVTDTNTANSSQNSGIDRVFYSSNSMATSGTAFSNTSGNVWTSPAITANGTYYVITYDIVGNRTVSSSIIVDKIDLNAPVISGEKQDNANWIKANENKTISATITDTSTTGSSQNNGIDRVFYSKDIAATTGTALSANGNIWTSPAITENGDFYIIAYDITGNRSVSSKITVDKIDFNPVTISGEVQSTTYWAKKGETKTISANISDLVTDYSSQNSGIDRVFYNTDKNSTSGISLSKMGGNTWTSPAIDTNGIYYIIAYDIAGNRTVSASITVDKIDYNLPDLTSEMQIIAGWSRDTKTISAIVTDLTTGNAPNNSSENSGIDRVFYATITGATTGIALTPNGTTWTSPTINKNGTYFIVAYDFAGNRSEKSIVVDKIDLKAPKATVSIENQPLRTWVDYLDTVTFGLFKSTGAYELFFNEEVSFIITPSDIADEQGNTHSGVISTKYYISNSNKSEADLKALSNTSWTDYTSKIIITTNQQFVIYVRVEDASGWVSYYGTDGMIFDNEKPEVVKPEIEVYFTLPETNANGYYNEAVPVSVQVKDNSASDTSYSGLKSITINIYNDDVSTTVPTQTVTKNYASSAFANDEKVDLTIEKASKNDSNNIRIEVVANDWAGNKETKSNNIKIDLTKPKVDISFDVKDAEAKNGNYFNKDRVATITIDELNFNYQKDLSVILTAKDKYGNPKTLPTVSAWKSTGIKREANVLFNDNTFYSIDITYTDLAGNVAVYTYEFSNTVDNFAVKEFVVDKVKPIVKVEYDNNDVKNTNYYKADRTATITVSEQNFNSNDFKINLKAENNTTGEYQIFNEPALSSWKDDGDTHTATINYTADGRYTFSAQYTDLANNKADEFVEQVFFVDKTKPVVPNTLADINVKNYVNKSGTTITPIWDVKDNNIDSMKWEVSGVDRNQKAISKTFVTGTETDITNGKKFTGINIPNNAEHDGIYKIIVTAYDKAGNENTSTSQIVFSVNRFGSTFKLGSVSELKNKYYKYTDFTKDVVITELNPNTVDDKDYTLTISKNGNIRELVEKKADTSKFDFIRNNNNPENGKWSEYTYTISKDVFKDDGLYIVTLRSQDTASNDNSSNNTNQSGDLITFTIDNTAPSKPAVSGVPEIGGSFQNAELPVVVTVTDNLKLQSVTIKLNGNVIKSYSAKDNDNETSFKAEFVILSDNKSQTLVMESVDAAGNVMETMTIENINVNSNWFVLYYLNKALFFGSIGGLLVIILGLAAFFIFRKKKVV